MEFIFLILTVAGVIATIVFGILQIIVHKRKGELRFSKRFPFVTSVTEEAVPAKVSRKSRRRKRRSRRKVLIPLLIGVVLVVAFLFIRGSLWQEAVAARRKPIAVMTFKNLTGESSFDYLSEAIPSLLITNLEQSRDLSVMTWERMHDVLRAMGKEDVRSIDDDLGFELCRMDGIEAIVLGSFTKAGDIFATDVKVLDVESKKLLKSTNSKGEGVGSILKTQIDELSKDISRGVGLSKRKIEATQRPIIDVATSSMDAYNYFLRGRADLEKYYVDDARQFLEKAVELDSTFATAYLYLAMAYGKLLDFTAMNETLQKAKAFSETTTEKERLYIDAAYAGTIEKNRQEQFSVLNQLAKKYPKEKRVYWELGMYYHERKLYSEAMQEYNKALGLDPNYGLAINGLAYLYADIGDFEKAIEYFGRYASVSPGDASPFDSMAELYFRMGSLDEAIAKYKEALEVKPDFFGSYWRIAYIYALKENWPEVMTWIDRFIQIAPSPGREAEGYWWKGFYYCWLGSLDQSISELHRAADLWKEVGFEFGRVGVDLTKGWIYYDRGDFELSRRYFKNWFDFIIEYDPRSAPYHTASYNFHFGLIDLKEGRIDSAKSRLAEMKFLLPETQSAHKNRITFHYALLHFRYDLLHAEVLVAEDSLEKAIAVCEKASGLSELEMAQMCTDLIAEYNAPFLKDALARAYLKDGDLDKAISKYEQLITFDPNSKERHLIHPTNHYRLAKLYEEKGSSMKAIEQYELFLEIWKDADRGTIEVEEAKIRLARLRTTR